MIEVNTANGGRCSFAKRLHFLASKSAAINVRVCLCSSVVNKEVCDQN